MADDPFHLGDHPVVLDNDFDRGRGSLGLASPGVTIYLPLTPTLCLAMTDALVGNLLAGAQKVRTGFKEMQTKTPTRGSPAEWAAFLQEMKENHDRVNEQVRRWRKARLLPTIHVMRVNSLQMLYAGRWLSKPNFSLPLKMIDDDPTLRERRKMQVE